MSDSVLERACPQCGQHLSVPTIDLRSSVRCPRCHTTHVAGALLGREIALDAVPATVRMHQIAAGPRPAIQTAEKSATPPGASIFTAGQVAADVLAVGPAILTAADSLDRLLYGRRRLCVGMAAGFVFLGNQVAPGSPVVVICATVYFVLLLLLALARIGSFRGEDGSWTPSLFAGRIIDAIGETKIIAQQSSREWLATLGKALLYAGLVGVGFESAGSAIEQLLGGNPDALLDEVGTVSTVAGFCGAILLLIVLWRTRSVGRASNLLVAKDDLQRRGAVCEAARHLPLLVDAENVEELRRLAASSEHRLLREILEALGEWRPSRMDHEDRYQASLHRHLRKRMPDAQPQREYPIGSSTDGTRGRADLVVGDCVLLELKRSWSAATFDRAMGQTGRYARAWKLNGPIVLLLCDVNPQAIAPALIPALQTMRAQYPVVAVVARGTRPS